MRSDYTKPEEIYAKYNNSSIRHTLHQEVFSVFVYQLFNKDDYMDKLNDADRKDFIHVLGGQYNNTYSHFSKMLLSYLTPPLKQEKFRANMLNPIMDRMVGGFRRLAEQKDWSIYKKGEILGESLGYFFLLIEIGVIDTSFCAINWKTTLESVERMVKYIKHINESSNLKPISKAIAELEEWYRHNVEDTNQESTKARSKLLLDIATLLE